MNNVGFCVFGRPVGLDYVSNGLFDDYKLGEQTYLSLPGNGELKDGDSIALLSRDMINDTEIIKLFIFEQAISFNERPGGFVGSGIVFSGSPNFKLLHSAVISLHKKALNLIDGKRKFRSNTIEKNSIQLINPLTDGLIQGNLKPRNKEIDKGALYGVKTDGPLINHITSIIQGFMLNPNFKNISKLYISYNEQLLANCLGKSKVLSIGQILDYSKYHKSHLDKLSSQQKQIKLNEEKLSEFEKDLKRGSENKQKQLIDLSEKEKQLIKRITELNEKIKEINLKIHHYNSDLDQKNNQTKRLSEEINKKNHELQEIKATINKITVNKFQELLDHNSFKEERNSYEKIFLVKQEQLNQKIIKLENQPMFTKKLAILFGGLALLIFIGGGILGYRINNAGNNNGVLVGSTNIDEEPEEKKIIAEKTIIKAPQEHKVADFLTLSLEKQNSHKAELEIFIEEIKKADDSKVDISNFLDRNWNFAEVIDYNKDVIDHGLARLKKIKLILEHNGKPVSYFTEEFMIDSKEKFNSSEFDFKTSSRNKILELYLQKSGNMYEGMNIQTEGVTDFEKDLPLLYMHFRWVLFNLSNYENSNGKSTDADILKTNKTKHNIPLNN